MYDTIISSLVQTAVKGIVEGFHWWHYPNNDDKVASSKKDICNSRLECKNYTLFQIPIDKNRTLWDRT